ncbi:MAG: class I SAM-dependent methyltransferase [Gammaproteobacteria bacterium]
MIAPYRILEYSTIYRTWQWPFARQKLRPMLEENDLSQVRRVLDTGCGPGTNTRYFDRSKYIGIDINQRYIASARLRHGRSFVVADVTNSPFRQGEFDFILLNSLLHHLGDEDVNDLFGYLGELLSEDGYIHVLDLVLPERPSPARCLARWDRGGYPRSLSQWREVFGGHFEIVFYRPYSLRMGPVTLWNMVYLKGRRRTV